MKTSNKSSFKLNCDPGAQKQSYVAGYTIFVAIWVKIIDFSFMPKIIRILRSCFMKIFSTFLTVNISKLHF